jgi:HK97 family phage portal protein
VGLGALMNRSGSTTINVTTSNEAGEILGSDVYTVTDGLVPSWAASPYRGAMNLPGAWRAAIIAADLLGSLPWEAYDRNPLGVPVRVKDQPQILSQPSPPDAGVTTISSWGLDYIWHGNAVALKGPVGPDGDIGVAASVPIGNVAIGRSNGRDIAGFRRGEVGYRIGNRVYHADEVIHIKGPCEPGALRGLGALECHLSGAISAGLNLNRQAGNLDVSGVPTGTLKVTAPDLTPEEAAVVKANWLNAQRARTVAVLNDVTDFEPLAWNPTETQLLEARKFSLHEIALIVGVPLYFLGVETSNRTYSNVEQEGIVLTRYHLAGAIRRFEAALTGCMRPGRLVQADLADALRADTLTRYQAWTIGITSGFLTPNEVRQRENLQPVSGGDELVAPVPLPQLGTQPDTGPPDMAEGESDQGRSAETALLHLLVRADPSGKNLHEYWTVGKGRARWSTWTELYHHLLKYLPPERAKRTASEWFHEVKGFWPGDKRNK